MCVLPCQPAAAFPVVVTTVQEKLRLFLKWKSGKSSEESSAKKREARMLAYSISPLLECYRHLPSALFLNRVRLHLVYLFYNIELENFLNKTVFISWHVSYLTRMKKYFGTCAHATVKTNGFLHSGGLFIWTSSSSWPLSFWILFTYWKQLLVAGWLDDISPTCSLNSSADPVFSFRRHSVNGFLLALVGLCEFPRVHGLPVSPFLWQIESRSRWLA